MVTQALQGTRVLTIGSGPNTLVLQISEDAWMGDAQFTVAIDGVQVGGTQTVTASRKLGQMQEFDIKGTFAAGAHTASVNFLNDSYGGTASTDRNLYVSSATIDGAAVAGGLLTELSSGAQSFNFQGAAATAASTTDTLVLSLSEDAWRGDAQFVVTVDGKQVGGAQTVTAPHSQGKSQKFNLTGQWGPGVHDVGIQFINDAYGGSAATDRNLYVDGLTLDGQKSTTPSATLLSNGTAHFLVAAPTAAPTTPPKGGTMPISLSATALAVSIGVNVNMDFFDTVYGNAPAVAKSLQYLGVHAVRDILPNNDAASLAPYAALVAQGIKFDFIAAAGGNAPTMVQVKANLDTFERLYPGAIASVEGPNEPNIWPISYNGQSGTAAAVAYQSDLYSMVKTDPLLAGVRVLNFAFGGVGPDTYAQAGNQSRMADVGNVHAYPDGAPQAEISNQLGLASPTTPGKAMAITEIGFSTYQGGPFTPIDQARLEIKSVFDGVLKSGVSSVFLYEAVDGKSGTNGYEDNFGQFTSSFAPKPAATALHNLNSILADPAPGSALPSTAFDPKIANLAGGTQMAVMEKTTGQVIVAVWNDVANIKQSLTLNFGAAAAKAEVFDPITGAGALSSAAQISSLVVSLGADPMLVVLTP